MTGLAGHAVTVDAVVGAARGPQSSAYDAVDQRTLHRGRNAVPVDPRYATLLSRILTASTASGPQCVLFVACDAAGRATGVALAAARAGAAVLGKTLLVDARLDMEPETARDDMGAAPVPDAFVPQLYHHRLSQRPVDIALLFGGARRSALNSLAAPFRFVAIDVPAPHLAPSASALASLCIGSVLVVTAGATTRHSIKEAAQYVTHSGGKLIGTVLDRPTERGSRWAGL